MLPYLQCAGSKYALRSFAISHAQRLAVDVFVARCLCHQHSRCVDKAVCNDFYRLLVLVPVDDKLALLMVKLLREIRRAVVVSAHEAHRRTLWCVVEYIDSLCFIDRCVYMHR